jgi:anaphase-promoting complex subunit 8
VRRAAELLDALPDDDLDTELTSCTENFSPQTDPVELRLEQNELPEYLMAKAFFDCHEPQRCAAVFLPGTSSENRFPMRKNPNNATHGKVPTSKCKAISQRALFLAWYALLMAGEKEKVEELNQILGPADTGAIVNKQLALSDIC